MPFEKNGMLTDDSHSDFDMTKKAVAYDADGFGVADKDNVDKLKKPVYINQSPSKEKK